MRKEGGQDYVLEAISATTLMAILSAVMREESLAWVASCCMSSVGLFMGDGC